MEAITIYGYLLLADELLGVAKKDGASAQDDREGEVARTRATPHVDLRRRRQGGRWWRGVFPPIIASTL